MNMSDVRGHTREGRPVAAHTRRSPQGEGGQVDEESRRAAASAASAAAGASMPVQSHDAPGSPSDQSPPEKITREVLKVITDWRNAPTQQIAQAHQSAYRAKSDMEQYVNTLHYLGGGREDSDIRNMLLALQSRVESIGPRFSKVTTSWSSLLELARQEPLSDPPDESDERHFRAFLTNRVHTARDGLAMVDQSIEEAEDLIDTYGRDNIASHDPFVADALQSIDQAISDVRQFEATFETTFANVE